MGERAVRKKDFFMFWVIYSTKRHKVLSSIFGTIRGISSDYKGFNLVEVINVIRISTSTIMYCSRVRALNSDRRKWVI